MVTSHSTVSPAPLAPVAVAIEPRTAVVLRSGRALHIGDALALRQPLARLGRRRLDVLLLDFEDDVPRSGDGVTESTLDRLACLPTGVDNRVGLATAVPSIARLAATAASRLSPPAGVSPGWFGDLLLAVSLLVLGRDSAVCECQQPRDLLGARQLAARLARLLPGTGAPFPMPLVSGLGPFLAVDGSGPMGGSPRGTLYLADDADTIARKVRSARTDSAPCLDPDRALSAEVSNLLLLLHATSGETVASLLERLAGRGYGALKAELAMAANAYLEPIRARRCALAADPAGLDRSLAAGARALEHHALRVTSERDLSTVAAA